MTHFSGVPWSDHPNAPKVSHRTHVSEAANFSSAYLYAVFYGIIVVLFFRCMGVLFNLAKRSQGDIKWPLVAHTIAMFSIMTISTATKLNSQSISYIDDREFPGSSLLSPGPMGYWRLINPKAVSFVSHVPLVWNSWLADGLLLYRCHLIFAMSYWAIAFPCLMFAASLGTGIAYLFQISHQFGSYWMTAAPNFGVIHLSISLSLNVLLTLMILARLIYHRRIVRNALGTAVTTGGLGLVTTMLTESCALNAVGSILYVATLSTFSPASDYFYAVINATQVIAPFLITLRVANHTALTSDVFTGGDSSMCFRSQRGSTEGDETTLDGDAVGSVPRGRGDTSDGADIGAENVIEAVPS